MMGGFGQVVRTSGGPWPPRKRPQWDADFGPPRRCRRGEPPGGSPKSPPVYSLLPNVAREGPPHAVHSALMSAFARA